MSNLKDAVLREFGDEGAETLDRYFAQVEYTALWCIRLIKGDLGLVAVIPEGVEDVVIERAETIELRQVKTRDEGQGPWTTAEVLPILCKLYHHRHAYPSAVHEFHFVSDRMADTKTPLRSNTFGPLFRLKQLLEIAHAGIQWSAEEDGDFELLFGAIAPRIIEIMHKEHGETISRESLRVLIRNTWIETDTAPLRSPDAVGALGVAFDEIFPGGAPYTTAQIREIYGRLILTILGKIRKKTIAERRMVQADVLGCRVPATHTELGTDLSKVPGHSVLDKKAVLGGFDLTEVPVFHRQRLLAEAVVRRLLPMGYSETIDKLILDIIDRQTICRDDVCRKQKRTANTGPAILSLLRIEISTMVAHTHLPRELADEQLCLGLVWRETDLCTLWWHAFNCEGSNV